MTPVYLRGQRNVNNKTLILCWSNRHLTVRGGWGGGRGGGVMRHNDLINVTTSGRRGEGITWSDPLLPSDKWSRLLHLFGLVPYTLYKGAGRFKLNVQFDWSGALAPSKKTNKGHALAAGFILSHRPMMQNYHRANHRKVMLLLLLCHSHKHGGSITETQSVSLHPSVVSIAAAHQHMRKKRYKQELY